jgi:hypothetical protein
MSKGLVDRFRWDPAPPTQVDRPRGVGAKLVRLRELLERGGLNAALLSTRRNLAWANEETFERAQIRTDLLLGHRPASADR